MHRWVERLSSALALPWKINLEVVEHPEGLAVSGEMEGAALLRMISSELPQLARPVIAQRERVRILDALDAVDYITVFATESLGALIDAVKPDVLTKGSNYTLKTVEGRGQVEKLGGRVVLIPVSGGASSTRIIQDIKNS